MRVSTWLLTAAVWVVFSCGHAVADEPKGEPASPEAERAKALASGMDALKLRVEAAMKRAALLEKLGKTSEALAMYESVEAIYAEGLADLRALIAGVRDAAGALPRGDRPFARVPSQGPAGAGGGGGALRRPLPSRLPIEIQRRNIAESVAAGLGWLAANQQADGSWIPDRGAKRLYKPGVTALSVMAFLGAGYTHEGDHAYNKAVGKALDYLRGIQDPEGCFGPRAAPNFIYNHAMATIAVVKAYAATEARLLQGVTQRALDFSALARNPYFGWRYGVKPGDNDTSVTHWMLRGIWEAKQVNDIARAGGKPAPLTIDQGAFLGALAWTDKMTDQEYGRVGYVTRGSGPARPMEQLDKFPPEKSEAMTAAGINIRLMAGQDPKNALVQKGSDLIDRLRPVWNTTGGSIDMYYWYLGATALEQLGGRRWKAWRGALLDAIMPAQKDPRSPEGTRGSWDPVGAWGLDGGRVYSTSIMLLALQVAQGSMAGER